MNTTRTTRKKKAAARVTERLAVVNLAEMGPRPVWETVKGCFMSLPTTTQQVLLHWLAYHLGSARADHEGDPLAPANYRDHCSGRATAANTLLAELRALTQGKTEGLGALRGYFGEPEKE